MFRQPEKPIIAASFVLLFMLALSSCSDSTEKQRTASSATASAAASEAASSELRNDATSDILSARQEAKAEVTASDTAALQNDMDSSAPYDGYQADAANLPPLPAKCEQYYRRVDQCFAKQGEDADALRESNQMLREELARNAPTAAECTDLNQSFNNLAVQLGCQ